MTDTSLAYAQALDAKDPLRSFRQFFKIDDPDLIYLDGNSLGRMPAVTPTLINDLMLRQWGERLIRSWNEAWIDAPLRLGDALAPLLGAQPGEIAISDSTSINLFKLAGAALNARPGRRKIISDVFNFPSDLYIFQGLANSLGKNHQLELAQSQDGVSIATADLANLIDSDTALVSLSHVAFKSAFMYDMTEITALAHEAGAMVLWDLSHSAGAVPVDLNHSRADLAVGCTYKYLNGGPGSPAFLYVRQDLQEVLLPPTWGWYAQQRMFDFDVEFEPSTGIRRFLVGTPPMLSTQAIQPALELLQQAGITHLRQKSIAQTEYLLALAQTWLLPFGFRVGSPIDPSRRGSHISLSHPEAYRICRALIEAPDSEVRVIPDFRAPDFIRLGIAPLYTSYMDIYRSMLRIRQITEHRLFEQFSSQRAFVT